MKKVVNFRIMLIFALSLLLSSITAIYFSYSANYLKIIFFVFIGLFILTLVLNIILKKKGFICLMAVFLLASLPFLNLFFKVNSHNQFTKFNEAEVIVYGRISTNFQFTNETNVKLILDEVYFLTETEEVSVPGKFVLYVNASNLNSSDFEIGRFIASLALLKIYDYNFSESSASFSNLSKNIIGYGTSNYNYVDFSDEKSLSLRDKVKVTSLNFLNNNNIPFSDVGFAMLFGDKSVLDSEITTVFQTTGIAHLLAVSGLHVSIIVLLLRKLLSKLKVPKLIELFVLIFILGFYAYLCEFSVSVVRAVLMAIFLCYASFRGKAYDNLSVLSLVAVILLIINPLYVCNVSFVLSFSSVFSIFLLYPQFNRIFGRVFKTKFSSMLALNCSVQVGLVLTTAYYFGKINLVNIFYNLISVPIAVCSFVIFIFALIIGLIFPFMSFICQIYGYLMGIVVKFNALFCRVDTFLYFKSFPIIYDLVIKCLIFILSDFYFTNKQTKRVAALVLVATCLQVCLSI